MRESDTKEPIDDDERRKRYAPPAVAWEESIDRANLSSACGKIEGDLLCENNTAS